MTPILCILTFTLTLAATNAAMAQEVDMDEVLGRIDAATSRFAKIEPYLTNDDPKVRALAFDEIVKLPEPALVEYAIEFGLFSDDAVLRGRALHTVLFRRTMLRVDLLPNEDDSDGQAWSKDTGGQIILSFAARFPDGNCIALNYTDCRHNYRVDVSGTLVTIDWSNIEGQFELNEEGTLTGTIGTSKLDAPVNALIRLRQ